MGSAPAPRRLAVLAALLALAPFLVLVARFDFVCDDAYISFRYARNLARGAGLVFNVGAQPPVEGYSELLWVLAMGACEALGIAPANGARVLSVAAGVLLVLLVVRGLCREHGRSPLALLGASLFLGTLPPLAVWTTGGLATMPFALCLVLAWDALTRARPRRAVAAVALAAAVLLRADGAAFAALLAGTSAVHAALGGRRGAARAALVAGAVAAGTLALEVGWRLATYGDWLPNTARAKLGFSTLALERGAAYVGHFLATFPGVALVLPLAIVALVRRRDPTARLPVAAWMVLGTGAYAVAVGGDFMCFHRFLVPALPFVAVLLAAGLARVEGAGTVGRGAAVTTALALAVLDLLPAFGLAATPASWRRELDFRWNAWEEARSELAQWRRMRDQAAEWRMLGTALRLSTAPDASLVYGAVGAVGYYSDRWLFDQHGLVNREVALRDPIQGRHSAGHDKRVPKEFFKKDRPTYLSAFLWPQGKRWPEGVPREAFVVVELDPRQGFPEGMRLALEPYDGL